MTGVYCDEWVQCDPAGADAYRIPADDPAMELVDVSGALNDPQRRVYSKVAKKAKLDALLDWRIKLKEAEEKQLEQEEAHVDVEGDAPPPPPAKKCPLRLTYRCYSLKCGDGCYSPTCRAIRTKSALLPAALAPAAAAPARHFSAKSTRMPISLKRIDDERSRRKRIPVKYPMMSAYMTKSRRRTIFVLPDHELRHSARRGAQTYVLGFHHGSKTNSSAWIYPSARPLLKTCWFFRTTGLQSPSAAALQLRILWACLRWEDMSAKGSNADGKNQQTTDAEIVTTELLRHRHVGRFLEKTQYFQRRVVIPLDVPKTVREVAPSRSGLRKRKLVEAPKLSQPIVAEEWVDEERLELWEIRQYHERMERAAAAAATATTPAGTRMKTALASANGVKSVTMDELKEKAEQQLRAQRAAHQLKRGGAADGAVTPAVVRLALPGAGGGKVGALGTPAAAGGKLAALIGAGATAPLARRILVSKTPANVKPVLIAAAPAASAGRAATPGTTTTPAAGTPNKIQITRGADGKIQIRGLQPGQQLMRLADGRFSIVSAGTAQQQQQLAAAAKTVATGVDPAAATTTPAKVMAKPVIVSAAAGVNKTPAGSVVVAGVNNSGNLVRQITCGKLQLATLNGQQVLLQQTPAPATDATKAAPVAVSTASAAGTPKQAIVLQSAQGTRIVVQNFQGGALTPHQLSAIQEQLKAQLAARAASANNNQATPTTIIVNRSTSAASGVTTPTPVTTTIAGVTTPAAAQPQTTLVTLKSKSAAGIPAVPAAAAVTAAPATPVVAGVTTAVTPAIKSPNKFVVTPDFIQQTIRKALKQENLHPDIEQKLLHLQRFQEKQKNDDGSTTTTTTTPAFSGGGGAGAAARKRTVSEDSGGGGGDPALKRSKIIPTLDNASSVVTPAAPALTPASVVAPVRSSAAVAGVSNEERELKMKERSLKAQQRAKERRLQQLQAKLQAQVVRHTELLKKDMLRKRALLEKELRLLINKEISAIRIPSPPPAPPPPPPAPVLSSPPAPASTPAAHKAPKSPQKSPSKTKKTPAATPATKKQQRQASGGGVTTPTCVGGGGGGGGSKKKLYCICRTPYDNSKFYVGCDLCSNWFHGGCVGITESMSQTMSEFVCDGCQKARSTQQLYCLCQQPYDESQFYICCDRCQDWFHGRCVGILQAESESIDEYTCPKCDPDVALNYANMRTLSTKHYEEMTKLVRQLQSHKSSWPFREPVSARDVPDYYRVIKEPMDLRMIDTNIQERRYQRLVEFIGDVTKIFDNCRYYNAKESNIARCATTLEAFFGPRLKTLRESLANG